MSNRMNVSQRSTEIHENAIKLYNRGHKDRFLYWSETLIRPFFFSNGVQTSLPDSPISIQAILNTL